MKNVVFIAPPAGGKGTRSEELVENLGYVHISTGELLRSVDPTTPLGTRIRQIQSEGRLVDDEIVFELLKHKLSTLNGKPFILDGCPRNIAQISKMDKILEELNLKIDIVIELVVPYEILLQRAIGRLNCSNCKAIFNKYFKKPLKENVCDKCGNSLYSRADDNEETFKIRFDTYMRETAPLIDYYKNKGILVEIDGVADTYNKIVSVIEND